MRHLRRSSAGYRGNDASSSTSNKEEVMIEEIEVDVENGNAPQQ